MTDTLTKISAGKIRICGSSTLQNGPWLEVITRKDCMCAISGKTIAKGSFAWRPLVNGRKRYQRVLSDSLDRKYCNGGG